MSILKSFTTLFGIDAINLSKEELVLFEAEIFTRICCKLSEIIREQNKIYFQIMKFNIKKENAMLENKFIRCIINDILSTEEYNIAGIAYYTNVPEDVIYDLAAGSNSNPTFLLSKRIIELHCTVRSELYREIANKIMQELG